MSSRAPRLGFLVAVASSASCSHGGGALAQGARDAAATDAAGPAAAAYAIAGPSTVSTCAIAEPSGPCAAPEAASPDANAASALYVVYYPVEARGLAPILLWGNGTGAAPAQYGVLLTHLASWGFVVVASTSPNTGTGREMLAGEDTLVAANADPTSRFFGRLDVAHVGALGHSQGADGAVQALLAADAPGSAHRFIATALPIELPAQEWTCFGATDPACLPAETFDSSKLVYGSIFYVDGSKDTLISPPAQPSDASGEQSVQAYYDATPAGTPRVKGTLIGADHNDIQDACAVGLGCAGVGPRGYLGYVTAWLTYQLRGDARARAAFAGDEPELDADPTWEGVQHASLP
jgi:hypothetical protein